MGEKTATVEVVNSLDEVKQLLHRTDILIFMTLGMRHEAELIKQKNPYIKVIVLTGLLQKDEVILIDKRWVSRELMEDLVFG